MKNSDQFITFSQKETSYQFLPTGDLYTILHKGILVNQLRGNTRDGSANNIYLRLFKEDGICSYPLLGIRSGCSVSAYKESLLFVGTAGDVRYEVLFFPIDHIWFWKVTLHGSADSADLIYGQDLGVGDEAAVYTNELYLSQYLGHSVFDSDNGYVVCSRQNMDNSSGNPYVQQGVLGAKAAHYSTDGLQFFGLSYKEENIPSVLSQPALADCNLQYEFAYTALQTERFRLDGTKTIAFYGFVSADHPEAVTCAEYQEDIQKAYCKVSKAPEKMSCTEPEHGFQKISCFGEPYASPDFTRGEIDALYPEQKLIEQAGDELYSFFTGDHAHVVTKAKELACERPHGTIIITPPDTKTLNSSLISSTQYMYGIFHSHVVIGNTDLHKVISTPRGFLNLFKNSGQRLYVAIDGVYRLLTLPGLFEMGMNYSRWYYKIKEDLLVVTAYAVSDSPDLVLEVQSRSLLTYDFLITNQLCAGANEYSNDITCKPIEGGLRILLDSPAYPGLNYELLLPDTPFERSDDRIFFEGQKPSDETLLTLSIPKTDSLSMIIRGSLDGGAIERRSSYQFEEEKQACLEYYAQFSSHFHLDGLPGTEQFDILNETIWWYLHNALIHFSMPHGLEQPGGAAWGTRDVCQGPLELFLATQHYELLRNVLINIFAHQNIHTGEWPQWFMFDRYSMNPGECHGDVIFWPLKGVADYLNTTGDYDILSVEIPYEGVENQKASLLEHLKYALETIQKNRILDDSGLITYAGGDWDDTLQPANEQMKKSLVSAWTVALAYQAFHSLSEALTAYDSVFASQLHDLAALLDHAFHSHLIKDDVIAGFLELGADPHYLLHPSDDKTGIHYRLLPMTRSIISGLVDSRQAQLNCETIKEKLFFPDGVRLMDKPADYRGGICTLFKRAEQAANVGREISLQYTHAHIRYVEAMAKLGNGQEAWDCLFPINPILIGKKVPSAKIRQSNLYFSSSDGAFADRYDYAENFNLLHSGAVAVKGGWRLYSSGPGIYLRQLISHLCGIRFCPEGIVIDPVLPAAMDGAVLTFDCYGRTYRFQYCMTEGDLLTIRDDNGTLAARALSNPYRHGGVVIQKCDLENSLGVIRIGIGSESVRSLQFTTCVK